MPKSQAMVKDLQMLFQMNTEATSPKNGKEDASAGLNINFRAWMNGLGFTYTDDMKSLGQTFSAPLKFQSLGTTTARLCCCVSGAGLLATRDSKADALKPKA